MRVLESWKWGTKIVRSEEALEMSFFLAWPEWLESTSAVVKQTSNTQNQQQITDKRTRHKFWCRLMELTQQHPILQWLLKPTSSELLEFGSLPNVGGWARKWCQGTCQPASQPASQGAAAEMPILSQQKQMWYVFSLDCTRSKQSENSSMNPLRSK